MSETVSRREFLLSGAAAVPIVGAAAARSPASPAPAVIIRPDAQPCVVASANGIRGIARAYDLIQQGVDVDLPKATFYVWMATPPGMTSMSFAAHLLEQAGIVVIPGIGLGRPGEGYVRLALTVAKARLEEALARLQRLG